MTSEKPNKTVKQKTKVVVRNIPYNLPETEFFNAISKYKDKINWSYYVQGKKTADVTTASIAYLNFKNVDDLRAFHKDFNGHVFVSKKGKKYIISVEYAPYQKISNNQIGRDDPRRGKISKDPAYIKFLQNYDKPVEKMMSAGKQLEIQEEEERKLKEQHGGNLPTKSSKILEELKDKTSSPNKVQYRRQGKDSKFKKKPVRTTKRVKYQLVE